MSAGEPPRRRRQKAQKWPQIGTRLRVLVFAETILNSEYAYPADPLFPNHIRRPSKCNHIYVIPALRQRFGIPQDAIVTLIIRVGDHADPLCSGGSHLDPLTYVAPQFQLVGPRADFVPVNSHPRRKTLRPLLVIFILVLPAAPNFKQEVSQEPRPAAAA